MGAGYLNAAFTGTATAPAKLVSLSRPAFFLGTWAFLHERSDTGKLAAPFLVHKEEERKKPHTYTRALSHRETERETDRKTERQTDINAQLRTELHISQ